VCCVWQVLNCSSFPCYKNSYCIRYHNVLFWPVLAVYTEAKFWTDLILTRKPKVCPSDIRFMLLPQTLNGSLISLHNTLRLSHPSVSG
jgi:hypothetical protein